MKILSKHIVKNKLLIAILFIAAILRFWDLGKVPASLTPDEAALGYNSYSILTTGRDEHGTLLPILFKSFGDYKPGLYIYVATPFIAVFGLNETSVRFPSALAGVISVFLIYLIVKELLAVESHRKDNYSKFLTTSTLPLSAAFILAINPWHLFFSRGAWEANLSLALTLVGIFFFLRSFENIKLLIIAGVAFSLTLLAYQGAKLSTTIVILALAITFAGQVFSSFKKYPKHFFVSILVSFVVALPVIIGTFSGSAGRLTVFSVFSYPRSKEYVQEFLNEGKEQIGSASYYAFHNEPINFMRGIAGRWFNSFSVRYLFIEGDYANPGHTVPYQGLFIIPDLLLFAVGFVALVKSKSSTTKFVFIWLLLAPLPAVLSRDQVQAVRSLNMVIPLVIICSFGLAQVLVVFWSKGVNFLTRIFIFSLMIMYVFFYVLFLDNYFVHLSSHNAKYWYWGNKEVAKIVDMYSNRVDKIFWQQSYDQPYVYYLLYTRYSPEKYQKNNSFEGNGPDVGLVKKIDNIIFTDVNISLVNTQSNSVFIADASKILRSDIDANKQIEVIKEIDYPNGSPVWYVLGKK